MQPWDGLIPKLLFFLWIEKILLLLCVCHCSQRASVWLLFFSVIWACVSVCVLTCSVKISSSLRIILESTAALKRNARELQGQEAFYWLQQHNNTLDKRLNLSFNSNIKQNKFQQLSPNVYIWQIQNIISELHSCLCEYLFLKQHLLWQTDVLWSCCKPLSVLMCGKNGFIHGAPCT